MSAPIKVTASVDGAEQMIKDLLTLGVNVGKAEKGAIRAGGRLIANEANINASALSSQPGRKVSLRVRKRKGYTVGSIYPAKGFAHLRLLEYGTGAGWRWARKGGPFVFFAGGKKIVTRIIQHPGTVSRPWLRPAFDARAAEAVSEVGRVFKDALESARIAAEGTDD